MSANDYVAAIRAKNKALFEATKIIITPASLEQQIKAAFEAGEKAGKNTKSIFEQMFGK